jgi:hypothetical protein
MVVLIGSGGRQTSGSVGKRPEIYHKPDARAREILLAALPRLRVELMVDR